MNDPLAFFITWTIYGSWLQGDSRGWRRRQKGPQEPRRLLAQWRTDKLKFAVVLLNAEQRACVHSEIVRLSDWRQWKLWACSARTNHVHVVVQAQVLSGAKVRDQLKANCTRVLRERWSEFRDRPVWSELGDWQCINDEESLEDVIQYVQHAQDCKDADIH